MDITFYQNELDTVDNIVAGMVTAMNNPNVTPLDIANTSKTIEIMTINIDDFSELRDSLNTAMLAMSTRTLTTEERLYLSRAYIKCAKQSDVCLDCNNMDIYGTVTVGERTFECFGERILEEFYQQ